MLLLGILCSVFVHQATTHSVEHCLTAVHCAALPFAVVQQETQTLNPGRRQCCVGTDCCNLCTAQYPDIEGPSFSDSCHEIGGMLLIDVPRRILQTVNSLPRWHCSKLMLACLTSQPASIAKAQSCVSTYAVQLAGLNPELCTIKLQQPGRAQTALENKHSTR